MDHSAAGSIRLKRVSRRRYALDARRALCCIIKI